MNTTLRQPSGGRQSACGGYARNPSSYHTATLITLNICDAQCSIFTDRHCEHCRPVYTFPHPARRRTTCAPRYRGHPHQRPAGRLLPCGCGRNYPSAHWLWPSGNHPRVCRTALWWHRQRSPAQSQRRAHCLCGSTRLWNQPRHSPDHNIAWNGGRENRSPWRRSWIPR